jgi:hypothetical protein
VSHLQSEVFTINTNVDMDEDGGTISPGKGSPSTSPLSDQKASSSKLEEASTAEVIHSSATIEEESIVNAVFPRYPVVVIASNRPLYLYLCLTSLSKALGFDPALVYIYVDAQHDNPTISMIASHFNITSISYSRQARQSDGAINIAQHYRFALSNIMQVTASMVVKSNVSSDSLVRYDGFIILEEDLIVSPDFLAYFGILSPLVNDHAVLAISAWNDNGFRSFSSNSSLIHYTNFFPGLGWFASRALLEELLPQWPPTHWDHWLREPSVNKNRHTVIPVINRVFHVGIRGVHSDAALFDRYFRRVQVVQSLSAASIPQVLSLTEYQAQFKHDILHAHLLNMSEVTEMLRMEGLGLASMMSEEECRDRQEWSSGNFVIIYESHGAGDGKWENWISPIFNLWHSVPIRGALDGVVSFALCHKQWKIKVVPAYSSYAGVLLQANRDNRKAIWRLDDWSSHLARLSTAQDDPSRKEAVNDTASLLAHTSVLEHPIVQSLCGWHPGPLEVVTAAVGESCNDACALQPQRTPHTLNTSQLSTFFTSSSTSGKEGKAITITMQKRRQDSQNDSIHVVCEEDTLRLINTCAWLSAAFPCHQCMESEGRDQPAFLRLPNPDQTADCLLQGQKNLYSCSGSHHQTQRLCTCRALHFARELHTLPQSQSQSV